MSEQVEPLRFKCQFCSKAFKSKCGLYLHKNIHLERFKCKICGLCCGDGKDLQRHGKIHALREKSHECHLCISTFFTSDNLRSHMKVCHPIEFTRKYQHNSAPSPSIILQQFKCEKCNKVFLTTQGVKRHMNIHSERFQCQTCGRCFRAFCELKVHQQMHIDRKYQCVKCMKMFHSQDELDCHQNKCTALLQRLFKCKICSKKFLSRDGLKYHNNKHLERYKCNMCNKCFQSRQNLIKHTKTHGPGRRLIRLQCSQCLCCFRFLDALKIHKYQCGKFQQQQKRKEELLSQSNVNEQNSSGVELLDKNVFSAEEKLQSNSTANSRKLQTRLPGINNSSTANEKTIDRLSITCDFCKKVCENRECLKQHSIDKHLGNFRAFSCISCQYASSNRRFILAHCRTKHGNAKLFRHNVISDQEKYLLRGICQSLFKKDITIDFFSFNC